MIHGKVSAAALLVCAVAFGGYAIAMETASGESPSAYHASDDAAQPAGGTVLTIPEIVDRVVAQGYSDVAEVEREGGSRYEVKARNSDGRWVELYVDARTGDILRSEREDY
jgi:uncharacterized membrane protein YkoI